MSEDTKNKFIATEQLTVTTKSDAEQFYIDCYKSFGWEITNQSRSLGRTTLSMKRNRRHPNRKEILELQRECEENLGKIERLQDSSSFLALIIAIGLGLGFAAMVVVSVIMAVNGNIVGSLALGIPGLTLCGMNSFVYKYIEKKYRKDCEKAVEQCYNRIYDICESAMDLL